MYASVTRSKAKIYRWFKKESPALKNPKIVRGEVSTWKHIKDGVEYVHRNIKPPYVDGTPIIRTNTKPSYILKLGESYRQDGKVKSRQKHICTFNEWNVIDSFLNFQKNDVNYEVGFFIDGYDFDDNALKGFPGVDLNLAWALAKAKIEPIESQILAEFKQTEEYYWWQETDKLRKEIEAEKNEERRKEKEYQRRSQYEYQRSSQQEHQGYSSDRVTSSSGIVLSPEEVKVVDACYKAMATQLHPDKKGGDERSMKVLNGLKDKIRKGR